MDCSAQAVFITELALVVRKVKNYLYLVKNGDVQQVKMVSGQKNLFTCYVGCKEESLPVVL